jgi:hypothetical protein
MLDAMLSPHREHRRWIRFAYPGGRLDRDMYPHHARDAEAALALQPALCARGYQYGGAIYNYPAKQPPGKDLIEVDDSFLKPSDLLVMTTRPPLDDLADGVRRRIPRSYTTLEAKVFTGVRRHLARCSRARVTVSDVHTRASEEVARLGNIQFRQKGGAAVDAVLAQDTGRWQRGREDTPSAVAYLIWEERAWENGPGLLLSFGMTGADTLAWNTLLGTKYRHLVAAVPFVMAAITAATRPDKPHTLGFLHDWKVRVVSPYGPQLQ